MSANPALSAVVAERLLYTLSARGVTFTALDDKLRYTAPAGALTPDLLDALRAHKTELFALLRGEAAEPEPDGSNCRHLLNEEGAYLSFEGIERSADIVHKMILL